jgi:hypothetical protein
MTDMIDCSIYKALRHFTLDLLSTPFKSTPKSTPIEEERDLLMAMDMFVVLCRLDHSDRAPNPFD